MTDAALAPQDRPTISIVDIARRLAFFLVLVACVAASFDTAVEVWRTGIFFDSDDAMRAVQVRDFLAGQGWYDLVAHRYDPPAGVFMHWSRVVDVPVATLEALFGLALDPEHAERAARLTFPLLMLVALLWLSARCARVFAGAGASVPALVMVALSGPMFWQFAPGRIDHHAPQIVLLMLVVLAAATGLERPRAFAAAAAGMAASFAISLENLPFFVAVLGILALWFVIEGAAARAALAAFAAGAAIAFPAAYAATVAPERWMLSACDAFSIVHLVALGVGVSALTLLAAATPWLATRKRRAIAVALGGGAVLLAVAAVAPRCLGDPLVDLDPLLRELWLSTLKEAKPLRKIIAEGAPGVAATTAGPVALAIVASCGLAVVSRGAARWRWIFLAATIGAGLAGGLWQVRVFSSTLPLAMTALAAAATLAARRLPAHFSPITRLGLFAALCIAPTPLGVALALPEDDRPVDFASSGACRRPQALAPLAALPPGRVAGPIELGPFVLAHTPHSVFAAPYHRGNHGGRLVIDAFLAPPDKAREMLRAAGADYLLWCAADGKSDLAVRASGSLVAALTRGAVPAFLERRSPPDSRLMIFALR